MSTLNRVWDPSAGPGFVTWKTPSPDPNGIEYPGPGAFGSTSDYCVLRDTQRSAPAEVQLHGLDYNPVGLWQFNGNGNDAVGSANIDTVNTGTEQYRAGILPGTQALYLDGATFLSASANNGPLQITGDLTVEFLFKPLDYHVSLTNQGYIVAMGSNGELQDNNYLYSIALENGRYNELVSFHEHTGGVNAEWQSDARLSRNRWHHIAFTRRPGVAAARELAFYVNGHLMAINDNTFVAPTGGTTTQLSVGHGVGASVGNEVTGLLQSLKIIDSALTQAQIQAEVSRLGRRP